MPRPRALAKEPKAKGRPPGSLNKSTAILKEIAQPYTSTAISTLVKIMNGEKYPAQARVAAAGMLMDRAWGKAHQSSDVTVSEAKGFVRAPQKLEAEEWKALLARRQAMSESVTPKPKPAPLEAKPIGKSTPQLPN